MIRSGLEITKVSLKRIGDKVAFFADVTVEAFGKILGCPVWKKSGQFRVGLPQRQGQAANFDLLRLEDDFEEELKAAVGEECERYEAEHGPIADSISKKG